MNEESLRGSKSSRGSRGSESAKVCSDAELLNLELLEPFERRMVRMEGLEPPYLTASDPKSDVSTNFTTSGRKVPEV
jgi:hypothetical protein